MAKLTITLRYKPLVVYPINLFTSSTQEFFSMHDNEGLAGSQFKDEKIE